MCRCPPGYLGEYCHHKDLCQPDYCLNGGSCKMASTVLPNNPVCVCPLGFTGTRCQEQNESLCYPKNPCSNGGTCSLQLNDQYTCQCRPGWTGIIIYISSHCPTFCSSLCTLSLSVCLSLCPTVCLFVPFSPPIFLSIFFLFVLVYFSLCFSFTHFQPSLSLFFSLKKYIKIIFLPYLNTK